MYNLVKFWDLYDITSSKRVFEADWKSEWVPFYRAREIVKLAQNWYVDNELFISNKMYEEYSKKYGIPKEWDIMVTWVWTLWICYVTKKDDKFYFKDWNIIWFKDKGLWANPRFIEYGFKSNFVRQQIDNTAGSVVWTYTIQKAKETEIPLPPLSTQSRIVARLDSTFANIDEQISLLRANIVDVENMRKSVLEESFQSGEYEAKKLWEIAKFIDYRWKTPVKTDSWIPLITAKNIRPWYIDDNPREYIAESDYLSWMTRWFPNRWDLAFTTEAPLWNIAEIDLDYKIALAQRVIVFQAKENSYIPSFLKYHILSPSFQKTLFEKWTWTTVKGIKASVLKEIQIPLPSLPHQYEIVGHLDRVFAETSILRGEYEAQLRDLEILKQSLLEEAFAGRLITD